VLVQAMREKQMSNKFKGVEIHREGPSMASISSQLGHGSD
jgi:hypothetical protein